MYWSSESSDGTGSIHKSKLNSNGSFSVGKTWKLSDLRGVEVVNVGAVILIEVSAFTFPEALGI